MLGKTAAAFSLLSLFAYSWAFTSPYAMPKMIVLAFGAMVIASMMVARYPVRLDRSAFVTGLVMLGVVLISALFSENVPLGMVGRWNSYALGLMGLGMVFLYHIASTSVDGIGLLGLAGAVIGLHSLAQAAGVDASLLNRVLGRSIGTMGHPVDLGIILAMCLPFAVRESKIYATAIVLGLLATGSRGAWISSAAGIAICQVFA